TWAAPMQLVSSDTPLGNAAVMDLNRDGNPDIVVAEMGPTHVLVFFGGGNGAFGSAISIPIDNQIPATYGEASPMVALADFDEDSTPDIAVSAGYICGSACGQQTVHIL